MLSVHEVTQGYGDKTLFDGVTVSFGPGKRFGLTGPNGAGKSTFMKFLAGDEEPQKGHVSRPKKTSILRQDHYVYDEFLCLNAVMMGNKPLWAAMEQKERILKECEESGEFTEEMGIKLGDLETVIAEEDGYVAESEAEKLLEGLGIPAEFHREKMENLSGGMKLRVLLAQALFGKPDCLLLDEPTNHLDMDSIRWLESFLLNYEGILVCISHDRHFLNAVTTHIADIDYETIITYTGNYDDMVIQKSQVRSRIEAENSEKSKKIAQLNEFVQKFGAGTRASQVQSRKKEISKLQLNTLKKSNIQRPFIRFDLRDNKSGKHVIEFANVSKSFVEKGKADITICKGLDLHLMRGDKMAIIGPSGIGKTTLVRMMMEQLKPDEGSTKWGHNADVGYFAQDHREGIPENKMLWEYLLSFKESASRDEIRQLLGRMLFSGTEGEKLTHVLSGGETARLLFSKLMLLDHNVLIFDEPTNHLDLESISALRDALKEYEGTVIFVTHDRDLVSDVATRVLCMGRHTIDDFKGTYDEYLNKVGEIRFDR